ncbi:MAG: hypothetical protein PHS44_01285 [Candidatus Dojkabacteria bacterium]|jgi:hypothetical protein|nr:hypothetical protein [Candidatus Dojkabacteria bacterium]
MEFDQERERSFTSQAELEAVKKICPTIWDLVQRESAGGRIIGVGALGDDIDFMMEGNRRVVVRLGRDLREGAVISVTIHDLRFGEGQMFFKPDIVKTLTQEFVALRTLKLEK